MKKKKVFPISNRHKGKCSICNHPKREEIEMLYLRCVPFSYIKKQYNVDELTIIKHARAAKLEEKRDRRHWYWRLIEQFDGKVSGDMAMEAAKQLDRLEGKFTDINVPTTIQVNYVYGEKIRKIIDKSGKAEGLLPGEEELKSLEQKDVQSESSSNG